MIETSIIGYGHYYPKRSVSNEELATLMAESGNAAEDQILGAVSIQSRHWADEQETVTFMGTQAAKMAMENAGVTSQDIDLVLLSNWTARQFIPELAPQIALDLNAEHALAFDLCGACAGFVHSIYTAWSYLNTGQFRTALVVSSEHFAKRVRPMSKGQLIVGDAAGAVVMRADPRADAPRGGLLDAVLKSEGSKKLLTAAPPPNGWIRSQPALIDEAIRSNVWVAKELMTRNKLSMQDIQWFVPHPGTNPVHSGIQRTLEIPEERFIVNFEQRANTGSASIPIVLSENVHSGKFKKGDLVLSPAVGSGWYYGGLVFRI